MKTVDPRLRQRVEVAKAREDPRPPSAAWETAAIISIREGRIAAALDDWDRALVEETDSNRRLVIFRRALNFLRQTEPMQLQYDPRIQAGALRDFLSQWTIALSGALTLRAVNELRRSKRESIRKARRPSAGRNGC